MFVYTFKIKIALAFSRLFPIFKLNEKKMTTIHYVQYVYGGTFDILSKSPGRQFGRSEKK